MQQKPRDSSCGLAQKLGFLLASTPAVSSEVSERYDAQEQREIWHQAAMMHSRAAQRLVLLLPYGGGASSAQASWR